MRIPTWDHDNGGGEFQHETVLMGGIPTCDSANGGVSQHEIMLKGEESLQDTVQMGENPHMRQCQQWGRIFHIICSKG